MRKEVVSVVVVSYNSDKTILETLDSIYNQTYSPVELIISDDCSSDNTVSLAEEWVREHGKRFVRSVVHKQIKNLGVPGNLNEGIQLSQGYFVKPIAADDLLLPDCLKINVEYSSQNSFDCIASRARPFKIENGQKIPCRDFLLDLEFYKKDAKEQYKDELSANRIVAPTIFMTRKLLDEVGLFDARYRYMDDYPMFLKLLKRGHKIHFLDIYTVEYRRSESSLCNSTYQRVIHPGYFYTVKKFFYRERLLGLIKYMKIRPILGELRRFFYTDLILLLGNDRRKASVRFLQKARDRKLIGKKDTE